MSTDHTIDLDMDLPLGEVVNLLPGSARVLESFGLDYCCGGRRPLSEACASKGLAVEEVRSALRRLGSEPPAEWTTMGPAELVDHLEATHHRYLHSELPRLEALAEKVASVHGSRHPELLEVLADVKDLREDLDPHLLKEERILFPMIRDLVASGGAADGPGFHCGSLRNPISVMLAEHDATADLLERLLEHSGGYEVPSDACASYQALYEGLAELEADTHLHVHKENNLLFPAVVALEDRLHPQSAP